MNGEKIYVISEASCGDSGTEMVSARNITDVQKMLLASRYCPNEYYCEDINLPKTNANALLCAILRSQAEVERYEYVKTPTSLGKYRKRTKTSFAKHIALLDEHETDKLFIYAFTGGEGEQHGNPGKEWTTISITPLSEIKIKSVYDTFDSANPQKNKKLKA